MGTGNYFAVSTLSKEIRWQWAAGTQEEACISSWPPLTTKTMGIPCHLHASPVNSITTVQNFVKTLHSHDFNNFGIPY